MRTFLPRRHKTRPWPARNPRRAFAALAALAMVASLGGTVSTAPAASSAPPGAKDVTATLFEWSYDSVATACTDTLGPKGYGFVEVSPAQEHIQGSQWWTSYQPVSYQIAGRLGNEASFAAMVNTCHAAGVKVVADAAKHIAESDLAAIKSKLTNPQSLLGVEGDLRRGRGGSAERVHPDR